MVMVDMDGALRAEYGVVRAGLVQPMLMRRKRMRKTLRTGRMAMLRAVMIFLSDLTRPKRRMTRRARRTRTTPVDLLVTAVETRLMMTTKASRMLHGLVMKGRNQWQKALTTSSMVKRTVKARLKRSTRRARSDLSSLLSPVRSSCAASDGYGAMAAPVSERCWLETLPVLDCWSTFVRSWDSMMVKMKFWQAVGG